MKWLRWARVLICIPPVIGLMATLGVNEYSLSAAAITVAATVVWAYSCEKL